MHKGRTKKSLIFQVTFWENRFNLSSSCWTKRDRTIKNAVRFDRQTFWRIRYYNCYLCTKMGWKEFWSCIPSSLLFLLRTWSVQNRSVFLKKSKGLVQLDSSLYSGWGFLGSQWDRQLKFSAYASFLILWSLSKFELI